MKLSIPTTAGIVFGTFCVTACQAFAPAHVGQSVAVCSSSSSKSKGNLVARNAFSFDIFGDTTKSSSTGSVSAASKALLEKAEDIVNHKSGFYSAYDADLFAEDFVFRGPYIGPLNKNDYLATMDAFGIYKAFPDIQSNAWGFSIDPANPNRVWFMVRNTGTFDGEPIAPTSINFQPNGATLEGCPETFSILFDDDQKMKHLTVGYVADRFEGNTAGKGAAVGIFHVIGLPFPKVGPVLRFLQFLSSEVIRQPPLSYSTDVPEWWTSKEKASEGYI